MNILTNGEFIKSINKVISGFGATPSSISLTNDQLDDMVDNQIFDQKMEELAAVVPSGGGGVTYVDGELVAGENASILFVSDTASTEVLDMLANSNYEVVLIAIVEATMLFFCRLIGYGNGAAIFKGETENSSIRILVEESGYTVHVSQNER